MTDLYVHFRAHSVGCCVTSLVSTHEMPVATSLPYSSAHSLVGTKKNVPGEHCSREIRERQ